MNETTSPKRISLPAISSAMPYLALLAGIAALSLSSLFVRWAQAPGPVTSFYRMLIAAAVMVPLMGLRQKQNGERLNWRFWWLPALGGMMTALDHATWSIAIERTRVANATLLNNIAPLWVALIAWLIFKERMSGRFWVGLVFTLTGAGVVFSNDLLNNAHLGMGDLIAVLSSVFYAAYFLVTQRGRQHFHTLQYTALNVTAATFGLLIFNLAAGNALIGYSTQTYLTFLAAAFISQIVGYFSVGYALGHLPASVVSPTMILQPVLTALLAIPLVGEPLQPAQWIGGLVVLSGIYLINRR